jgi:hypothetical protein
MSEAGLRAFDENAARTFLGVPDEHLADVLHTVRRSREKGNPGGWTFRTLERKGIVRSGTEEARRSLAAAGARRKRGEPPTPTPRPPRFTFDRGAMPPTKEWATVRERADELRLDEATLADLVAHAEAHGDIATLRLFDGATTGLDVRAALDATNGARGCGA